MLWFASCTLQANLPTGNSCRLLVSHIQKAFHTSACPALQTTMNNNIRRIRSRWRITRLTGLTQKSKRGSINQFYFFFLVTHGNKIFWGFVYTVNLISLQLTLHSFQKTIIPTKLIKPLFHILCMQYLHNTNKHSNTTDLKPTQVISTQPAAIFYILRKCIK